MKQYTELPPSYCYIPFSCKYTAAQKGNLKRHIQSIHKKGATETFPCPDCDYTAKWKVSLQTHINSVHNGATFPCQDCEYIQGESKKSGISKSMNIALRAIKIKQIKF